MRGASSDILSRDCVERMAQLKPDLERVEVPGIGHAPMLTETKALTAIRDFLDRQSDR